MTNPNPENKRFFARRVTKELIASLVPASEYPAAQDSAGFWGLASKIGDVFKDLLGGALGKEKPENISSYQGSKAGASLQNPFGFFLVVNHHGRITVITDPGKYAPAADAEVFLVADLVGLPIARISGELQKSFLDTTPGEFAPSQYAINLWLDPGVTAWVNTTLDEHESRQAAERIGRFLTNFMIGKNDLTIEEFCKNAEFTLGPIIQNNLSVQRLKDFEMASQAKLDCAEQIARQTGLTSEIFVRPSSQVFRHQVTLDDATINKIQEFAAASGNYLESTDDYDRNKWICQGNDTDTGKPCRTRNELTDAFCGNCGGPKPSAVKEASQQVRRLVTADGDQLVLDLGFLSYNRPNVDIDAIAMKCIEALRPVVRKFPISSFADPLVLTNLASLLNKQLGTATVGNIGEFSIMDYRSGDSDWQLQTRAKIKEQLRSLGDQEAQIEVEEASIALRLAQLTVAKKGRVALEGELREALETKKLEFGIELEDAQLDSKLRVDKTRLDVNENLDVSKIQRDADRELRKIDREDTLEDSKNSRVDDITGLEHDFDLEKRVLRHDIDKDSALDDASRLKAEKDLSFEEKLERLKTARELDKKRDSQNIDLDKMRAEKNLDMESQKLEADLQLRKLQAMGQMDLAQRDQFKGMTAAQILAMQATSTNSDGKGSISADMIKAAAENDSGLIKAQAEAAAQAAMANKTEELYKQMLAMQMNSNEQVLKAKEGSEQTQLEIMKAALAAAQDSNSKVIKAHEKSTENAERWNEKSIDAMAKVASSAAGKGGKTEKSKEDKKSKDNDDDSEE
jgi:hypothetical protein